MRTFIRFLPVLAIVLASGCCSGRISVGIHDSNDKIRERLLTETPTGASVTEVTAFVTNRLCYREAEGVRNYVPFEQSRRVVKVTLGRYLEISRLFLFHTYVWADWRFDEQDRLAEIRVRRGTPSF